MKSANYKNCAHWKPVQLDEPFREELSNPSAYKSLNIAHFLKFSESSSKTPFLSCTVICVILDYKS